MVIGGSRAAQACVLCCCPDQEEPASALKPTPAPAPVLLLQYQLFNSDMDGDMRFQSSTISLKIPSSSIARSSPRPFCITDQVVNCLTSIVCSMGPPHTPTSHPTQIGAVALASQTRGREMAIDSAISLRSLSSLISLFSRTFFLFLIVHPTSSFDGLRINTNMTSSELSPPRVGYLQVASTSAPLNTPRHPLRALHHPSYPRAAPPNLSHSARSKASNTNLKSRGAPRISRMSPKRQSCG